MEEAAEKVKISKKSLDDYLMQLRCAKKFGFDFARHSGEKVGVIRSFVKKKKLEERRNLALKQAQAVAELNGMAGKIKAASDEQNADNCPFPFVVKRPSAPKRDYAKKSKTAQFKKKK